MRPNTCLLPLLLLLLLPATGFGQAKDPAAKKILDKVSAKYRKYRDFKAQFQSTMEGPDGTVFGKQEGTILVKGAKFRLRMDDMTIICNGETVYNIIHSSKEVNITDYQPGGQLMTPTEVYDLYKHGYKYALMSEVQKNGRTLQTIDLEPENLNSEVMKVRLVIDKSSHRIIRWITYERGTNNRRKYEIKTFEPNIGLSAGKFRFEKGQHSDKEIIDLR